MEFKVSEEDSRKSGIYRIKSLIDNRVYYGSAKNLYLRFYSHCQELKRNIHGNAPLQNFYNKYGFDLLSFELMELVEDLNNLLKVEQKYLDQVFSSETEKPFNILKVAGSSLGRKMSDEQKLKMSRDRKGKKLGASSYIWTDQRRERLSKARKEFYSKNRHPLLGTKLSEEAIQKMSESRTTGFLQYDFSGKLIAIHTSNRALAKLFNTPRESFHKAANGRLQTLKGFIWKYLTENYENQLSEEFMSTIVLKPQKKIFAYSCEGELIAEFKSALDFQNRTGWDRKHIKKVCRRQDNRYKNLFWILEE